VTRLAVITNLSANAAAALNDYRSAVRWRVLILASLCAAVAGSFLLDLTTGPSALTARDAIAELMFPGTSPRTSSVIVWEVRLPQALIALMVGIALSIAGAEMQTVLNNTLASPFTLGMSSAATFGAALAIVLGLGLPGVSVNWIVSANAFVFAFGSAMLLQVLGMLRGSGSQTFVLFGIALFFTFNALVAITQFVASEQSLQQLVFWMLGSLNRANMHKIGILALVVAVILPMSLMSSWRLTALRLGQMRAQSLGINVARLRFVSLLRISILTAAAVSFTGTIAFIGLVGPHIARLLVGEDHRFFLPASALAGAMVMSLASVASKTLIAGIVLPIGVVTALIGVPFFLALILGRRVQE
jgi:iron complex transport system permease protein